MSYLKTAAERALDDPNVVVDASNPWGDVPCIDCGVLHLGRKDDLLARCFGCSQKHNPFAAKGIRMSVDATGEDSTNPGRIKDGTHEFNAGLPPVPGRVIGKDAYGQTRREWRPTANNEVTSARRMREIAKRNNLTPQDTQKRAVGARSR
jgi:hypothetical protein